MKTKETRESKNSVFHKAFILSYIKENGSQTISQLATLLNVTRPTIYGHLDILENRGLITRSKDIKRKGAPVTIDLTAKADPIPLNQLLTFKKTMEKIKGVFG